MILVDWEIKQAVSSGEILIDPFDENLVQPNSIDVRLGSRLTVLDKHGGPIDPYVPLLAKDYESYEMSEGQRFEIQPGEFVLGATLEKVQLPSNIVAQVTGKSSLARYGLMVHVTAGFIDCGFSDPPATITLELVNTGPRALRLHPGMPIGQLVFTRTAIAETPYNLKAGAKYNGQEAAQVSKYFENTK